MFSWQWEDFKELIKNYPLTVNNHGPLVGPVHSFSIERGTDLSLRMQTEASVSAIGPEWQHPPGTVRINDDRVTFHADLGLELEAIGVHPLQTHRRLEGVAPGVTTQEAKINRLRGRLSHPQSPRYVIDWLENVPSEFLWPALIETKRSDTIAVTLGGVPASLPKLIMSGTSSLSRSSWAAAALEVDRTNLFLCTLNGNNEIDAKKPGCIVYDGVPSDGFRDRIRRCLSFSLGSYLVYLGVSRFNEQWRTTDFEVLSPYSMRGEAMRLPPMPPSPLGTSFWEIDATKLSRMVNAIYMKYDELNFGVVSWAYWHALTATPHIAAVHFGAALESLQRAYLRSTPGKVFSQVVDEQVWNNIQASIESSLDSMGLPDDTRKTFKNKIRNLNLRSQHSTGNCLVDGLGLTLGKREKQVLNARHASAHGKDDEIDVEWIRDLKLLRIRFHRMLLAMTKGSEEYYDYFTLGNPSRRVEEPVPD